MMCHCFRMDIVPAPGRITTEICTAAQQANVLAYKNRGLEKSRPLSDVQKIDLLDYLSLCRILKQVSINPKRTVNITIAFILIPKNTF